MRNYRQIMENRNLLAWGGGKSQGDEGDEPIIYDIAYLDDDNQSYTAIEDGEIFYLGAERTNSIFPHGFETQISISISEERLRSNVLTYQLNVIKKKSVSKNEVLNFSIPSLSGILILTEKNVNITDFLAHKSLVNGIDGSFSFTNNSYFQGFGFLSYILSSSQVYCIETKETRLKYSMITNNPDTRGNAIYSYNRLLNFKLNSFQGVNSVGIVLMKLQKGKKGIKSIQKLGVSLAATPYEMDFIPGYKTYTSPINGFIIFTGAYRENENYLLNGFTIIKTSSIIVDETEQTLFIGYKQVNKDEVIRFDSKERFGGVIYPTLSNLNNFSYVTGKGVKSESKDTMLFPIAENLTTNFGIIGHIQNTHVVTKSDLNDLVWFQSSTHKRLTSFVSNDYLRRYSNIIEFKDTINPEHAHDLDGIWVEFIPK